MSQVIEQIPILDLSNQIDELWDELNVAIQRVLKSGQFILGPEVKAFEEEIASYLGVKHAIGLNSGTDALVIGLRALGIGAGDEVITSPFSFFATAESISNVGAKPVFVDIEESSFNIDPEKIEAAITEKTKAIMPVHLYGNPANMKRIMEIAQKHKLKVIEDCAQSIGARYFNHSHDELSGKSTGTIGDVGAFSFFPTKNLGAYGDGGLLTTHDDDVAQLTRKLRAHGGLKKYHNEILGYNSRLDAMQAAILRVKLPHIDTWNSQRFEAASRYNDLLADVEGVIPPTLTQGHVFHQYTIRLTRANRDQVEADMKELGIGTMVYYPIPQDQLPVYAGQYPVQPISQQLGHQVLSLPIWPEISKEQQLRVVDALVSILHA
ncbi:MAG: DegT/DnrJ/EryC1/StrS family aminotransferase [Trueperaceae bacterium]|nr:DegT/DnrJ/EryC1/StrS family aminotransferase [Trueperaceae bacterium]